MIRRAGFAAALLAAACALFAVAAHAKATPSRAFRATFDAFLRLSVDDQQVAPVTSLMLERDAGTIVLEEGRLALCRPVEGRVVAALFTGRGVFSFTPPNDVERGQLERFYGTRALRAPFTSLVIVFADSTLDELRSVLRFAPDAASAGAAGLLDQGVGFLVDRKELRFRSLALGRTLLRGPASGFFYAQINRTKGDPLFFAIDPFEVEGVRLLRPSDRPAVGYARRDQEIVCQFRAAADTAAAAGDERPDVETADYRIESTITSGLAYSQVTDVAVRSRVDSLRWVHFWITPELDADSAAWDDRPAEVHQGKESDVVWVRCDPPLARGESRRLTLRFSGDLIVRRGDWVAMTSSIFWYPRHDLDGRTRFELIYHVPAVYQLASVGERVASATARDVTTTRWVTKDPVWNVTFNLGFFKSYDVRDERAPPVHVMITSTQEAGKTETLERAQIKGGNIDRLAAAEFSNSAAFFQHVYGPPPLVPLWTTEVFSPHGEAFPGLIETAIMDWQLVVNATGSTLEDQMWHRLLRAHEVAHQWWGYGVDNRTYHDKWLTEGLSEWSALWYLQAAAQDDRAYLKILKEWREAILSNRKWAFGLGRGQEAGPIWLGWRTSSERTGGDYGLIVYKKSAWVMHMLRNYLLDLDTLDDHRFRELMAAFYRKHVGGKATTEDFAAVVSEHAGEDMGWFFRQWVYGTSVPEVRFTYRTAPEGASTRVTCRVEMTNVPDGFRIDAPVLVRFKGDRFARVRVRAVAPATEFDLPLLPESPSQVVFNDLESVLCQVTGP